MTPEQDSLTIQAEVEVIEIGRFKRKHRVILLCDSEEDAKVFGAHLYQRIRISFEAKP